MELDHILMKGLFKIEGGSDKMWRQMDDWKICKSQEKISNKTNIPNSLSMNHDAYDLDQAYGIARVKG